MKRSGKAWSERGRGGREFEHVDSVEIEFLIQGEHVGGECGSARRGSHGGRKVAAEKELSTLSQSRKTLTSEEQNDSRRSSPPSDTELDLLASGVTSRDDSIDCERERGKVSKQLERDASRREGGERGRTKVFRVVLGEDEIEARVQDGEG